MGDGFFMICFFNKYVLVGVGVGVLFLVFWFMILLISLNENRGIYVSLFSILRGKGVKLVYFLVKSFLKKSLFFFHYN